MSDTTNQPMDTPMPPPPYVLWKGEARCPECFALMGEPHGNGLPKAPNDPDDSHPCAVGLYIEQVEALKADWRRRLLRAQS